VFDVAASLLMTLLVLLLMADVKIDYCGGHDSPTGHHAMSAAMNATGRHMVLALCRGPYQQDEKWGYAPEVAQVWRATGDHHDEFSCTMKQVRPIPFPIKPSTFFLLLVS
jgi:hypothetical protein